MVNGGSVLGIDVGERVLHCVELAPDGNLGRAELIDPDATSRLVEWAEEVEVVAIDAPARPSTRPHAEDPSLSGKFTDARCAEIELGRQLHIWVPWPTPVHPPFAPWMEAGFRLFELLGDHVRVIETFPHAVFSTLAGSRVASKRQPAGLRERITLLGAAGLGAAGLAMWGHDGLDAAAAALVARDAANGTGRSITCGHDGSAIWLPAQAAQLGGERDQLGNGSR